MKRIIVILIFAMLLIPGVNAQEEYRQTETTVHYGSESVLLSYGYKLNPDEAMAFDLYPLSHLYLAFSINVNETVRVTDTRLSIIMISCPLILEPLVLEVPDGNISDRSSYVALCLSDGSTIFDYNMKYLYSYSYSNYDIWVEESFILYVANHENVSLVTLLNLEFTYSFTYEVTRFVELNQSESAMISILSIAAIIFLILGVSVGMWYRPYWDGTKEF